MKITPNSPELLVMDASAGRLKIRKKSMRRLSPVFSEGDGETGTPFTAALTSGGAAERISPVVNAWLEAANP